MADTYPIFLSSLCRELWGLRQRIFEEVGHGTEVYVDEKVKWRNTTHQEDLEAADELIRRIREAKVFVCILGGRRIGSPVKVDTRPSAVSFFEIELFQAALTGKNVHLFVRDDFEPEPRLRQLLKIIGGAFPEWVEKKPLNDARILDEIRRLVDSERRKKLILPLFGLFKPIRRLVQALSARVRNNSPSHQLFLENQFERRGSKPNINIISDLFDQVRSLRNEERRLSRLWIVVRELMCVPYTETHDKNILSYWSEVLGQWARAGAWYGLHGDTPLGCLAALKSLAEVRAHLQKYGRDLLPELIAYPGGALASAKYSIAKRLIIPADRKKRLNEALEDIRLSQAQTEKHNDGLLAIRGSILRQLYRYSEAVSDYEVVLTLRQQKSAPDNAIGEALSELGFGYLYQGRLLKGLDYCEKGVELLRTAEISGFLVRALKKLAIAYLITGRPVKAYETWMEVKQLADETGAFDQLGT